MNGRSTLSKATQQHGRQSDQITNGTWKVQQRVEGKNTINNLYADESPRVGKKLQRCRRTQDKSQDDSSSSRSPEDVPSKSYGPMDIIVTTRIGNGDLSESWNSKVNDIRSGCCHQEEEIKPTAGTIQSRQLPSPINNSRCQVSSSQANCYQEEFADEGSRSSEEFLQKNSDEQNTQLCISESRSRRNTSQSHATDGRPRNPMEDVFKRNSLLAEGRSDSKHIWTTSSDPQECRTQPIKESVQDATTLIQATTSEESEVVRITQSTASQEDS
ncbi:hypothetical protein B9Z55_003121 [Caenorhabditis nigoni]|uniref:Uncharacterized protein n=1 Tax=Caenorhabditis nigoni TaxID=1611254 RepID=A0A2G5VPA4_9PELO|nr:hypothetical protein B9Z55_003121 [Caenorhabditis nigoni]